MSNFKQYSIFNDTPTHKVNTDTLTKEIRDSSIVSNLDFITTYSDLLTIQFKSELSESDITLLDLIVNNHSGLQTLTIGPVYDNYGNLLISNTGNSGWKETFISPNWCDKTTWYGNSTRISGEVLTSIDYINYSISTPQVLIDAKHWKIPDESIKPSIFQCHPEVYVNDTLVLESYYVGNSLIPQDYTIDYSIGLVTFNNTLQPTDVVKMNYNKLNNTESLNPYGYRQSTWTIKAPEGYRVLLNRAEVQFSDDLVMRDSIRFVPYTTVGKDPMVNFLMYAPYNYPENTEIPLPMLDPTMEKRFNNMMDFIDDSDGCYYIKACNPLIRELRDLPCDMTVYKWQYQGTENMELNSKLGRFMKIFLKDDQVFYGTRATATLYGTKYLV